MTTHEFIAALKVQTSDAAVSGTKANFERPPGRRPREKDVALSRWYLALSAEVRASVDIAIREAAELAVFSFLCVLDGVSAIENGPEKGDLRLDYIKSGIATLLNDPNQEYLHDIYNALCQSPDPITLQQSGIQAYRVGPAKDLRAEQSTNDGIDLHSVSPVDKPINSPEAPAIALPKNEHRKL